MLLILCCQSTLLLELYSRSTDAGEEDRERTWRSWALAEWEAVKQGVYGHFRITDCQLFPSETHGEARRVRSLQHPRLPAVTPSETHGTERSDFSIRHLDLRDMNSRAMDSCAW